MYGKEGPGLSGGGELESMDMLMTGQGVEGSACPPVPFAWSPDFIHDEETSVPFTFNASATQPIQNYVMDPSIGVDIPFDGALGPVGHATTPKTNQWIAHVDQNASEERSESPVDDEVLQAYDKMTEVCVRLTQTEFSTKYLVQSRLGYCVMGQRRLIDGVRIASSRGICMIQQLSYTTLLNA